MKVLNESDAPANVLVEAEVPEVKGKVVIRPLIVPGDGADRFIMNICELSEDSAAHLHDHDYEHEIYVIEGSLSVDTTSGGPDDVKKVPLKQGDAVFIPRGESHGLSTGPNETARLLLAVPASAMGA
jgi:quercetin dioxygenase-like cupin family protein